MQNHGYKYEPFLQLPTKKRKKEKKKKYEKTLYGIYSHMCVQHVLKISDGL